MVSARKLPAMPVVIAGSALAGALYAFWAGEDVNWDWQNYHDYAGFALLQGRFDVDVAPGGFQSYLNPLRALVEHCARCAARPQPRAGLLDRVLCSDGPATGSVRSQQ